MLLFKNSLYHAQKRRATSRPAAPSVPYPVKSKFVTPRSGHGFERRKTMLPDIQRSFLSRGGEYSASFAGSVPHRMALLRKARCASHAKSHPAGWLLHGGAEGNRTPVRKQLDWTFSGHSLLFTFPRPRANKHAHGLGRVIVNGRVNSFPPHGHHSDHTLARLVVLPGRMGA